MLRLIAVALIVLAGSLPAKAQQQPRPAPPPVGIEDAVATETYLERRWLLLQTRMLLQKIKPPVIAETLAADAQRIGTRGPSMAEVAVLDGDLAIETAAYVDMVEKRIRGGDTKWPADRPAVQQANEALIELEFIRQELKEARAKKRDEQPAMARAGMILMRSAGQPPMPGFEPFAGRDLAVNLAMEKIRLPTPKPKR